MKNKQRSKIVSYSISFVLVLHLLFLYYIKYLNQGLSLSEFSLANIGNISNLVFTLFLISGIIIYFKKNNSERVLIIFLVLMLVAVQFAAYLSTLIEFPPKDVYIFGQQGNKVFEAFLFTVYQLILFSLISFVWLKILASQKMLLLRSLLNGVFMLFFFLFISFVYIQAKGNSGTDYALSENDKNVGVVLGAAVWSDNQPSPSLAGRVEKAIQLYKKGFIGSILLTGSNAPGELTEAGVAYEYAKKLGMDMDKVHLETGTTSTTEQISYIKKKLINNPAVNDVVVISDAYHLVRVHEISKFFNIKIKLASSGLRLNYKDSLYRKLRESIALVVFWSFAL